MVGSRRDSAGSTAWLRDLAAELNDAYAASRLADFGFTQGDEIQGLLAADADPLVAVLHAALGGSARPIRWVCIWGGVDPAPPDDPATQHTGSAFLRARAAIEEARVGHDRLVIRTGRPDADALLGGMTPALMELLDDLTPTQRVVARLAIIEGLRQSEVAEKLNVRRATISVSFARSKIAPLQRLIGAIRLVCRNEPVAAEPVESAESQVPAAVEPTEVRTLEGVDDAEWLTTGFGGRIEDRGSNR